MSPPVQGMGRPFELLRELGQTYRSLERDSVQAQLHQAESEAKINFLETQLLVQEKLNLDLGRRVKMLEQILLKERHELRVLKKTLAEGGGGQMEVEVEKNKAGTTRAVGEREGADEEAAETDTTTTSEEAAGSSSSTTSATSEAEVTSTTSTDADAGKAVASSSANAAPGEAGGEIGGMKSTKTTPATRTAPDSNTSSSPEQETKGGAAPGTAGAGGAPSSSSSAGTGSSTLSKLSEIAQRLPQSRAVSARQKLRQYLQTSLFLNDTLEADLLDQIGSALSAHVTSGGSKSSSSSGQRSSSSSCTGAAQTLARAASSCSRTSEKESPGAATSSSSQPSKTRRGSGGDTSSLSDQVQVPNVAEKQKRAVKAKAAAAARDGRSEAEDQALLEQQNDDHHHSTSAPGGEIPEINSEVVPHQTSTELVKQDWRWYASVEGPFCGAVQKLCYDNQRAILISGSEDGVMCLFDMHDFNTSEDVEPFHVLRNPGGRKITAMAADFVTSNIFVTGDISGSVTLWKVGLRAHTAAQETAELRDKNKQTPPVLEEKPSKGSSFDFLEEITDLSLRAPHIIAVSTKTEVHLLKISPHNPALGLSKINTVFKPYEEEEEVDLDTAGEDNLVSAVEKKSKLESDSEEDKGKEVKESGSIKKGSSRSMKTTYYPSQVAFVKDDLLVVGFKCLTTRCQQEGNASSTRTIKSATMYEIVEEDEESAKKSTDKSKEDDGERGKVEEDVENEGGKGHKDGNESATKKNSSTSSEKEGTSKNGDVDDGGRTSGSSLGRLVLKEVLTYKSSVTTSAATTSTSTQEEETISTTTTTLMKILLPSVLATVGTSDKNSVGEIVNAASVLRLWDLPTGKNIAEEDFAVLATEQGLLPRETSTSTRRVDITGLSYDSATGKVVLGVGSLGEVWVYDVKGQSITQRIESFTESLDALLLGVEDVLFVGGLSVCQRSSGAEVSSEDDHGDGAEAVEKMGGKGKKSPSSSTGGENKEKGSMVTSTRNRWGHVRILTR